MEAAGEWLLTLYQALAASRSYLPRLDVHPRKLGWITGACAAGVVLVAAVGGLAALRPAGGGNVADSPSPRGDVRAESGSVQSVDYGYAIRCNRCSWGRALKAEEVGRGAARYGAYLCENCRSYTAYPQRLPRSLLAPGPASRSSHRPAVKAPDGGIP